MWLWLQKLMKFFQGEEEQEEAVEARPVASPQASSAPPVPRKPQAKTKSIYPKERVNARNIDDVRPRRERQFRFPVVPDDYLENKRNEKRNQQAAEDSLHAHSPVRERETLRPREQYAPEKQAETIAEQSAVEYKRDIQRRQTARRTESVSRTLLAPEEKKAYRPSEIVSPVYGKITPSTREAEHRIHTTGGVVYPRLEQEEHLQQIKQREQEISEQLDRTVRSGAQETDALAEVVSVEGVEPGRAEEAVSVEGVEPGRAEEDVSVEGVEPGRAEEAVSVEGVEPGRAEEAVSVEAVEPEQTEEAVSVEGEGPEQTEEALSVEAVEPEQTEDAVSVEAVKPEQTEEVLSAGGENPPHQGDSLTDGADAAQAVDELESVREQREHGVIADKPENEAEWPAADSLSEARAEAAVPEQQAQPAELPDQTTVPVSAEEEKQVPAYTQDVNRLLARAMPDAQAEASAAAQAASAVSEAAATDILHEQSASPLSPVTELPEPPAAAKSQEQPYALPSLALLNPSPPISEDDNEHTQLQKLLLEETLSNFNVSASVVGIVKGPSVTRFELQPAPGVKVNKITGLIDDIKLNLAAKDIRIEAPIPGRNAIGIEVPNLTSRPVLIEKIIGSEKFQQHPSPLAVALGMDIGGEPIIADIKKMPHGLIAGATGSGKSVCINSIIVSLLYKATPEQVRLLLIDPKMVELAPYNHLPHLVTPVVTEAKQATAALKWAVEEMEKRYALFVDAGVRDIDRYNQTTDDQLPYIVIVIDELADLMMVSPQDVEDCIIRIAQKARACGIHLLLATQRPSVDVITGNIKANVPTRLAFAVFSQVDSRTILDQSGAERLLGRGDMLFLESGTTPVRLQGNFVSDDEIERITQTIKKQRKPTYLFSKEDLEQQVQSYDAGDDPLYMEALLFVAEQGQASASGLQRRFRVGYNRAARLIEMMEADGYVAGQSGGKARAVLITREDAQAVAEGSTLL
ncbi:DNA translocase FtsK [Brevibacillus gelatini]|uniref:DNA translocase FtsK n=1 Tax=Brevibacillus gelatini TaxID=1655277 RepID=A0A3M8AXK1_9BACL|nr:DNA translocase FtsK [Brevibacillus gelatini]RNB55800.1 DNA translocase FtsK [Brevibacillus gelatini]